MRVTREGVRHGDGEGGAFPDSSIYADIAANLGEVVAHHVHAHAASGKGSNLVGGTKARLEDEGRSSGSVRQRAVRRLGPLIERDRVFSPRQCHYRRH